MTPSSPTWDDGLLESACVEQHTDTSGYGHQNSKEHTAFPSNESHVDKSHGPVGAQSPSDSRPAVVPVRKSSREIRKHAWIRNYVSNTIVSSVRVTSVVSTLVKPKFHAFLFVVATSHDPASFQEAVQDLKWSHAINLELCALEENNT